MSPKLLVICGPTATGKTSLAVKLAKKFNGEIVSADSRQVYKGMDIGTGKDLPKNAKLRKPKNSKFGSYLFNGIPVWGLDLVNPNQEFSVAHYQKFAQKIIKEILKRRKLPILIGGTGFYIKAIIEDFETIGVPPDKNLRRKFQKYSLIQLQNYLKKINHSHFNKLNRSDKHNPRRLIRAIEIAKHRRPRTKASKTSYDALIIGLKSDNQTLYRRIDQRVEERIKMGTKKEVKNLLKKGCAWKLPSMSALGYRQWQPFFKGKKTQEQVIQKWKFAEHAYARRQLSWFKKVKRIHWFNIAQKDWQTQVEKKVKSWYTDSDAKKS